jgi:hypothetical protein
MHDAQAYCSSSILNVKIVICESPSPTFKKLCDVKLVYVSHVSLKQECVNLAYSRGVCKANKTVVVGEDFLTRNPTAIGLQKV